MLPPGVAALDLIEAISQVKISLSNEEFQTFRETLEMEHGSQ